MTDGTNQNTALQTSPRAFDRPAAMCAAAIQPAAAMQTFHEWNPDLLVSDIGMPNEDGYSLIKRLRELDSKHARQIPAVALTAYATDEDRLRALAAGFQIHIAKPIEPENFVTCVASVLGRNGKN
ncbi:MAG: response regulator [Pyrinomonadaceae bacterium]